jgi:hypothetical protein
VGDVYIVLDEGGGTLGGVIDRGMAVTQESGAAALPGTIHTANHRRKRITVALI